MLGFEKKKDGLNVKPPKKGKKSFISKLGLFDRYNLAFFLTSVIPLSILTYLIVAYVSPALIKAGAETAVLWLQILVFFLLFLAILGFFVSRAATQETVDKLKDYNDRLQHLFDISQSLSRQQHLDVLLQDMVKSAIEMTGASAGLVLLRDDSRNCLKFEVSIGTGAISFSEIPFGKGIAGWVAQNGKLCIANDVDQDSRYDCEYNILPNFHTSAIIAAPLGSINQNYGTLELLHRKEDHSAFTEEDASVLKSLAGQASIFIENARFREDQQNYFTHIIEILLSALEGTRQFWPGHLKNTARYSYLLGKHMNLSDNNMRRLHYAALIHDIGFVKINLREGSPRKMIELHPEIGYEMIKPISLWQDIAPIIRYHHERFDGTGYPHQVEGNDLPLESRILAVAETFDVLTNIHSYRNETLDVETAYKEIKAYAGTQFDPDVVQALRDIKDHLQI